MNTLCSRNLGQVRVSGTRTCDFCRNGEFFNFQLNSHALKYLASR